MLMSGPAARLQESARRCSGRQVKVPRCIAIFHIAAGKVDQGYLAWDNYALLQQLGVLPMTSATSAHVS